MSEFATALLDTLINDPIARVSVILIASTVGIIIGFRLFDWVNRP